MGLVQEFKEFAVKGNVMDMAIGVIVGGAFGKIVSSLVDDVIMPPIGKLLGGVSFSDLFLSLGDKTASTLAEAKAAGIPTLNYGNFLQTVLDFGIVALAVFVMVKLVNTAKRKQAEAPAAPAAPPEEVVLLREIRDALKK